MDDKIVVTKTRGTSVTVQQAQEFVKLIEAGATAKDAALEVGASPKRLFRSPEVQALVKDLEQYVFADPEVRRALILAQMTKDMLTSEAPRDRIAAAKVLTSDPEAGFTTGEGKVVINISDDVRNLDNGPLEWQK